MRFSSTSVGIFADFLGHDTQMAPLLRISNRALPSSRSRTANELTKIWTISQLRLSAFETTDALAAEEISTPCIPEERLRHTGASPGLMPSFFQSGVPEYPLTTALPGKRRQRFIWMISNVDSGPGKGSSRRAVAAPRGPPTAPRHRPALSCAPADAPLPEYLCGGSPLAESPPRSTKPPGFVRIEIALQVLRARLFRQTVS